MVARTAGRPAKLGPATSWDDDELFEAKPRAAVAPDAPAPIAGGVQHELPSGSRRNPKSRPARKAESGTRWSAALWGLFGFLFGIVFWHMVGFWGFMNDVLLPAQRSTTPSAQEGSGWSTQSTAAGNLHVRPTAKQRH